MNIEKKTIKGVHPFIPAGWWLWMQKIESFVRVRIFKQRKYLIGNWTYEESDTTCVHGIDAELELRNILKDKQS